MLSIRKITSATLCAGALAFGLATTPVAAQQGQQRGLVNVAVFEVIDDITIVVEDVNVSVAVAADIAANVCGVTVPVAVLAQQVVAGGGTFTCSNALSGSGVTVSQQ